jgi:hypothetical protein
VHGSAQEDQFAWAYKVCHTRPETQAVAHTHVADDTLVAVVVVERTVVAQGTAPAAAIVPVQNRSCNGTAVVRAGALPVHDVDDGTRVAAGPSKVTLHNGALHGEWAVAHMVLRVVHAAS